MKSKKMSNVLGFLTASLGYFLISYFWMNEATLGQIIFSSICVGLSCVLGVTYLPKLFHFKKKIN